MIPVLLSALAIAGPTLDIRVEGDGFLRLGRVERAVYATRVTLTRVNGALGTPEGDLILPRLMVPATAKSFSVDLEGNIRVDGAPLGRLVLAVFPPSTKLTPLGSVLTASVRPTLANPGEGTAGVIRADGSAPSVVTTPPPTQKFAATPAVRSDGTVSVMLRTRTEVAGETFTVGDIAEIQGDPTTVARIAAVPMGASPILGTERGLVASYIVARIRYAGIDAKNISVVAPPSATVVRKFQTISSDQMIEAARGAVRSRLGLTMPLIAAKAPGFLNAAPGDLDISAEPGVVSSGGVTVTLTIKVNGKYAGARSVTLMPEGGLVGVKVGDTVRIRMVCNGAVVESEGRAASAGWIGQSVNVTIGDGGNRTNLTGNVVAAGVVEVKA